MSHDSNPPQEIPRKKIALTKNNKMCHHRIVFANKLNWIEMGSIIQRSLAHNLINLKKAKKKTTTQIDKINISWVDWINLNISNWIEKKKTQHQLLHYSHLQQMNVADLLRFFQFAILLIFLKLFEVNRKLRKWWMLSLSPSVWPFVYSSIHLSIYRLEDICCHYQKRFIGILQMSWS